MRFRNLLLGLLATAVITPAAAQTPAGTAMHIDYNQFAQDNLLRYVNAGNDATLNPGGSLTMEMWHKVWATTWNQKMIGKLNANFNSGYMMAIDQGHIYPEIWTPNLNEIQEGTIPAAPSPYYWMHFAVTFEAGGDMNAYINGELIHTQPAGALPIVDNSEDLIVGIAPWDLSNFQYFGSMDEIRIWNVARTAQEIKDGMYMELTGSETGLMMYYNCNGGSGSTMIDNSPNGNDGNMVNMGAANWVTSNAVLADANGATMTDNNGLWNAIGTTDPRFVTTSNGLSMTASNIAEDDYTVFGHNSGSGTSSADLPTNAAANFERADRVWYLTENGDMTGDFIFDLDNAAGGGATISTSQNALNYTLLYRSGSTGDFTALYGANAKNGNVLSFNNVELASGYYSIGVGDDVTVGATGIDALAMSEGMSVYPNPSNGQFSITLEETIEANATIEVLNAIGEVIQSENYNQANANEPKQINLSHLDNGVYFIRIQGKTARIIIQK